MYQDGEGTAEHGSDPRGSCGPERTDGHGAPCLGSQEGGQRRCAGSPRRPREVRAEDERGADGGRGAVIHNRARGGEDPARRPEKVLREGRVGLHLRPTEAAPERRLGHDMDADEVPADAGSELPLSAGEEASGEKIERRARGREPVAPTTREQLLRQLRRPKRAQSDSADGREQRPASSGTHAKKRPRREPGFQDQDGRARHVHFLTHHHHHDHPTHMPSADEQHCYHDRQQSPTLLSPSLSEAQQRYGWRGNAGPSAAVSSPFHPSRHSKHVGRGSSSVHSDATFPALSGEGASR